MSNLPGASQAQDIDRLAAGVAAWNAWRTGNPHTRPNLAGADLSGRDLRGINLAHADLSGCRLSSTNLANADLSGADLSNATLERTDLTGTVLNATLWQGARLSAIRFARRGLRGKCAGIGGIDDAMGDTMFRRELRDQDYIDSLKSELRRNYPFAWNDNSSRLLRDIWNQAPSGTNKRARLSRAVRGLFCGLFGSLNAVTARAGVVFGLAVALLLDPAILQPLLQSGIPRASTVAGIMAFVPWIVPIAMGAAPTRLLGALAASLALFAVFHPVGVATTSVIADITQLVGHLAGIAIAASAGIAGGILLSSLVAGWYGRTFFVWTWSRVFDNGRDWYSVVAFGGTMVILFGCFYQLAGSDVIRLPNDNGHPLYPWFVALMGFCTLGITNDAVPVTGMGMLIMAANVLSGFLTLGLLISVLGNAFANRS